MIETDLKLSSYHYDLPPELIATRPAQPRHASRLLIYNEETGEVSHDEFINLDRYLPPYSSIVLNQSKVFPCRLLGKKKTGGAVEVFILSLESSNDQYPCLLKSSSKKNIGDRIFFDNGTHAEIVGRSEQHHFFLTFSDPVKELLDTLGSIPIPPYIRGGVSDDQDVIDYQTTYAKETGSVAAPTAGLHFTPEVFDKLKSKNINPNYVTLHVGLGTFAPVKTDSIKDHQMHHESYFVEDHDWQNICHAQKRVAVGTTSLRVLESLWPNKDRVEAGKLYDTNIFLHPGVEVESIDALVTNFHLPGSTLLMLVSSLIGREKTLELYELAIKERYRFFSYGDAMLILRKSKVLP